MAENDFACTVVSIVPFPVIEYKPGLTPARYFIEKSDGAEPKCLVVKEARFGVYIDDSRGSIIQTTSPNKLAESIVRDFIDSQLGRSEDAYPGLFWVYGNKTPEEIKKDHVHELMKARLHQTNWFIRVCSMADDDWNRYGRNNVISDFQRKAGEILGYTSKDHPWMSSQLAINATKCPGCGTTVSQSIVICPNCRYILDKERYKVEDYAVIA